MLGAPLAFQTATAARVGDLTAALAYAVTPRRQLGGAARRIRRDRDTLHVRLGDPVARGQPRGVTGARPVAEVDHPGTITAVPSGTARPGGIDGPAAVRPEVRQTRHSFFSYYCWNPGGGVGDIGNGDKGVLMRLMTRAVLRRPCRWPQPPRSFPAQVFQQRQASWPRPPTRAPSSMRGRHPCTRSTSPRTRQYYFMLDAGSYRLIAVNRATHNIDFQFGGLQGNGPGQFGDARALDYDAAHNLLFVADTPNNRVEVFSFSSLRSRRVHVPDPVRHQGQRQRTVQPGVRGRRRRRRTTGCTSSTVPDAWRSSR